jgi:hypothetical protein
MRASNEHVTYRFVDPCTAFTSRTRTKQGRIVLQVNQAITDYQSTTSDDCNTGGSVSKMLVAAGALFGDGIIPRASCNIAEHQ